MAATIAPEAGLNDSLRRTALNSVHKKMGGRMVTFGGWEMPIEYMGIISEHMAVRTGAGLFDVSHMGEIEVRGREALRLVQHVTSNDAARLAAGQAQYSALMYPQGTVVDDLLVHKMADDHYFLVVNAANQDRDFAWINQNNRFDAQVRNAGADYTQLAIQGPKAPGILQKLTGTDLAAIRYYWFARGQVDGVPAIIARTGYTGEDGFEIYFDPNESERLWERLLEAGRAEGLAPCGLGARNTLRLEAAMALYGHEIDETHTPLEANLGWICKLEKGEFLGRETLLRQKQEGLRRRLAGFEMTSRGIAREGYPVYVDGVEAGYVTSGSPAPFLKKNIGLAYLPVELAQVGRELEIGIRKQRATARIVDTPFYKRQRK
jgi:aminomethyltransferase